MTRRDVVGSFRFGAAGSAAALLLAVYASTLAPDVTFWDAGEFIASAHALGMPHPPGTPLFILLLNVWARVLFFLPYAVATNLFSAVATVLAAWVTANLVRQATGDGAMAFAAAVCAGSMSSVWLNATETEVYAASLALAALTIWAANRAGQRRDDRWTWLTAYLIALAVPLHLSSLVVGPVAILLASLDAERRIDWRRALLLGGVFVFAMGAGRMTGWMAGVGAVVIGASVARPDRGGERRVGTALVALWVAALAVSAILFLYVRAQFDPGINQGNPNTLRALSDVIARRQYAVSPMWPREAPAWVQLGNLGQYADWQVALSFGPTVLPSILRTLGTVLFLVLGWQGAVTLWLTDRRFALAMLALFACGALGVLVYLNLHAGPSIGYGILPANVVREARERDYFYVFGFWAWGIWAGIGAVAMATRFNRPRWAGILVACLPIVMNWRAVTRRGEPEQSLPRAVAEGLLRSAPRGAVLFVVGDNDSYPLWYAQQVLHVRPDVAVITIPLLPTHWYRDEIARRYGLLGETQVEKFDGRMETSAAIADGARRVNRPVAAAVTLNAAERSRLGTSWRAQGLVYVEAVAGIDTSAARRWAEWVAARVPARATRAAIDPVNEYFRKVLDCPRQLGEYAQKADSTRLDSVCNYR